MGKKKRNLTQSQINGISWIAIALIISLGVYVFSRFNNSEPSFSDTIEVQNTSELKKLEDSVYRSRRKSYTHHRKSAQKQNHTDFDPQKMYSAEPPMPTRKPLTVELNGADTTTLTLLHGIGPTFARRIIRYREKLGGFTSTTQLLEVYGFTPALLEHIEPHLRIETDNLRKININTVELKQLIKHPYVDYYFARDLINLRSRGISFTSPDDLRTIPSCNDTMLNRLLPYLDFQ